jgi:hypothetical protein
MEKTNQYTNGLLTIDVSEEKANIKVAWHGKSVDREPGKFITPILVRLVKRCSEQDKRLVLDFRHLSYMNSSTITPVIKILERARRGSTRVTVLYDGDLKWQELIFSALTIFTTKDDRVELQGVLSS